MTSKSTWIRIVWGALPLVILAIGVGGLYALVSQRPESSAPTPRSRPPLVETVSVEPHMSGLDLRVDGLVVPHRELQVAAEVLGRIEIKSENCRAGHFVRAGEMLFQLDRRDLELEVRQLGAQLEQAQAALRELQVEISNTERLVELAEEEQVLAANEVQRLSNLSGGRLVSESELDRAKRAEVAARNALAMLVNQLTLSRARQSGLQSGQQLVQAQLARAELDLSRTVILAPIDGVVVEDMVEQNAIVQPGTVLATIEDTSAVEVQCSLRMEELTWLWRQQATSPGQLLTLAQRYEIPTTEVTVEYRYADRPDVAYRWDGVLDRYEGGGLDERTRTVRCRVLVDRPEQASVVTEGDRAASVPAPPALIRGMFVSVVLHVTPPARLVRVPELGVRPGKAVWLARRGELRIVQPVPLLERIEVDGRAFWVADAESSGLVAGDRLIVSPLVAVTDGMAIREQQIDEVNSALGDS